MDTKNLVLVIGVGRSGTSALTRVLSLAGCALPERLLGPIPQNARGCWEPLDALDINHRFMRRFDTEVLDPAMHFYELELSKSERESYVAQIQTFLSSCNCRKGMALVVKEPTITQLMEFWLEAAVREGFTTKAAIAIRHPDEVHRSFSAFFSEKRISKELMNAFWIKLNLLAETQSRSLKRVFVEYPNLLHDWRAEIARVAASLELELAPDEAAIDEFLSADLRHQRLARVVTETFGYDWTRRIYEMLSSASRGDQIDTHAFDEIYRAYRATERTFRIAAMDFGAQFSPRAMLEDSGSVGVSGTREGQ